MLKEGKFGTHEAVCLITITITAKVFFTSPGILAAILGTSSWYMTLLSAVTATVGFTFIYLLLKRFPGKNIVEAFEASLGRVFGGVFCFLLAMLFMINSSVIVREFVEVLKVYVLPLTSISSLVGTFVTVVTVVSFLGLETIARFAKLSAYILLISFILVLILASQKYEIFRIFPIFGHGLSKTIQHGLVRSSFYGEVLILAVVAGSLQGTKYIKKAGYMSLVLSGILVSSALLAFTLAFPYYTGAEITAPMYQLTAMIDYGRFLQRLEPIFLFIWFVSSFVSVTAIFYTAASLYCKMFRIQDMRPTIFPLAIILFTVAMIPSDITTVATGYIHKSREYGWIILYIPPLIALIVANVSLKIQLEGDLLAVQSRTNYESKELKPVLEKAFEQYIKDGLDKLIEKCKRLNSDVFRFGGTAARQFATIEDWEQYNRIMQFEKAEVNTEVEFTIRRTGAMLKSSPVITTKEKE